MEMIAHSPKMAKKAGVPQSVGKDFAAADKGKTFKLGGEMAGKKFDFKKMFASKNDGKEPAKEEASESKAVKSGKISKAQYAKGEKREDKMKCGGSVKGHANGGLVSRGNGCASSGKTRTKVC